MPDEVGYRRLSMVLGVILVLSLAFVLIVLLWPLGRLPSP
jgi:hypothetical protein